MPPHKLATLRRFFQDYKQLEKKKVEVEKILSASEAYPVIRDALERYRKKFGAGLRADQQKGLSQRQQ